MPALRQLLPARFFEDSAPDVAARGLLDVPVVAVKLTTGAPCDGHAELFQPWPGPETHVRQWFLLADGKAVGINEDPAGPWTFPVMDAERPQDHER